MSELDAHIKRINEKLQHLLKKYAYLQKENARLKQEVNLAKKNQDERNTYISLLEQRNEVLQVAKGAMGEEERKNFEKRIRQYLKEIDKCITFMSE